METLQNNMTRQRDADLVVGKFADINGNIGVWEGDCTIQVCATWTGNLEGECVP